MRTVVLFVVLAGCASANTGTTSTNLTRALRQGSPASVLTAAELSSVDASSTPEAVMRLRPEFLRGSTRATVADVPEIAVYLNDRYDGDASSLATIPLGAIQQMVFMHPTEARTRFGPVCRCANGAIAVTTR